MLCKEIKNESGPNDSLSVQTWSIEIFLSSVTMCSVNTFVTIDYSIYVSTFWLEIDSKALT